MTKVQSLKREIKGLTHRELAALRQWFQEYDSTERDREIEKDALSGRFDELAEKAIAEHKDRRTNEIQSILRCRTLTTLSPPRD